MVGNRKNIVTLSLVEEGYEGRAGEGIVKVSQGYIRFEMAKLIMVSIYLSRLSLCSASCYVVHIICSKLNLITLMFVSVSSQYYQAASIFIPPEEISSPLPDYTRSTFVAQVRSAIPSYLLKCCLKELIFVYLHAREGGTTFRSLE